MSCCPVEGIDAAIRTFYDQAKKISFFGIGDDISGDRAQPVVDVIDRLNRADAHGNRRVRIQAIGFPVIVDQEARGRHFCTLMRSRCDRTGETFVGLTSLRP
jgi:hypothetical protein